MRKLERWLVRIVQWTWAIRVIEIEQIIRSIISMRSQQVSISVLHLVLEFATLVYRK